MSVLRGVLVFFVVIVFASSSFAQLLGLGLECAPRMVRKSISIHVSTTEGASSRFINIIEGSSLNVVSSLAFTLENVNATISCDESCGAIVSSKLASFVITDANGTTHSFDSRRENDFVVVSNATIWIDGITAVGECTIKCKDGTLSGECSKAKPLFCSSGVLVNKSSVCGCPPDTVPFRNACRKPVCADGTAFGDCSFNRPFFCTYQGVLVEKASVCGCPRDYAAKDDECTVKKCVDGTPYNQCSLQKPKFCFNGTFIDDPVACSCPENYTIGAIGCVPIAKGGTVEKDSFASLVEMTFKYLIIGLVVLGVGYFLYSQFMKKRKSAEEKEKWIKGEIEEKVGEKGVGEIGEIPKKKK